MSRQERYILENREGKSFDHDQNLPPLPLPKLNDTLENYFLSLKAFGSPAELEISRKIIDDFKKGFGKNLHSIVEEKSWSHKNWINDWLEQYRFHSKRCSIYPYVAMALPLPLESVNVPENEDYSLKAAARCLYHKIEFWQFLHHERIRPVLPPNGMKYFSMEVFKRFFCTSRIPGESHDVLKIHFKTVSDGRSPTHGIIIGRGRIFQFECLSPDGNLITIPEILKILQCIRGIIFNKGTNTNLVPILTCDDRSSWAKNRKHLQELSVHNKLLLELIESSIVMACLDEHSPKDYSESSQLALTGDFFSKWADRSTIMIIYRNGKISLIGEPSAYDGRCCISFAFFLLLSLLETGEPNWSEVPTSILSLPVEHTFDLDEQLRTEIARVLNDCEARRDELTVSYELFTEYGRRFIDQNSLHWDSYIQILLVLTYYQMHRKYPSVDETILLRNFYHGRTDVLRRLPSETITFIDLAKNHESKKDVVLKAFKAAVNQHTISRGNAKNGHGFHQHLFGLYSAAVENQFNIPELFLDPLFARSGGFGRSTLFTSTSGFTLANVFQAPMVDHGYGFFYSLTMDGINFITTAFKTSPETSAHKFSAIFRQNLIDMKILFDEISNSKL